MHTRKFFSITIGYRSVSFNFACSWIIHSYMIMIPSINGVLHTCKFVIS